MSFAECSSLPREVLLSPREHPQCCQSQPAVRAGVWSGLADVPCTTSCFLLGFLSPHCFSSQNLWVCTSRPRWRLLQTLGHYSRPLIYSPSVPAQRGDICAHTTTIFSLPLFLLPSPCCSHLPRLHPARPNPDFLQPFPPLCC